jgi:UDP-glucose 4-epimerase
MAVLVAGASGFLGSRLVQALASRGEDVVAVARSVAPATIESDAHVRWVVRDIARDGLDAAGFPDVSVVVHLAGATLGAGVDENRYLTANEQTTVRLAQAFADRVEHFVFASSQVVYGDARHRAVTEEFPLHPEASAYACSKVNSENWLRWFQKRHGGQYLALRLSGFIDGGGIVDYLIDRALAGEKIQLFSEGKVCRDYLPVAEGTEVLIAATRYRGAPGFLPVNVGSGQAVSAAELAAAVCGELGSTSPVELSSNRAPQGDFVHCIERARQLFGFVPGQLIDAVRSYARHRRDRQ